MLKWLSRLTSAILAIVLVLTTILAISSYVSGGNPKFFNTQMMMVLSGSMEPEISTGSIVLIKDVEDPTSLQKGDVITFYSPIKKNMLMTHRIQEVRGTGPLTEFITKGDNNEAADPRPIPAELVVGEYTDVTVPYLGYFISFIQSPKGIGLMLIIPGLLLILYNMYSIWRAISDWEKEKGTKQAQA